MVPASASEAPWSPRTFAAPNTPETKASSPKPSQTRPQRASRDRSTMGANVQLTPPDAASAADVRPSDSDTEGSKLHACASGMGKIVRWPWMTSRPISSGMPCADSSTATRCTAFVAAALIGQNSAPMPARARSAHPSGVIANVICNWASFSARVSRASRESTRVRPRSSRGVFIGLTPQ